jgi:hypothetical protein
MDNGFAPGAIVRLSQQGPEISRQRVEEKLTPQTSAGTPFHWYAERSPNEARFCQALFRSTSREARLQPAMRRAAFGGARLWPDHSGVDIKGATFSGASFLGPGRGLLSTWGQS